MKAIILYRKFPNKTLLFKKSHMKEVKKMGNRAFLEQELAKYEGEIKSVFDYIVRHHGPGPYTVWDDDLNAIDIKKELAVELIEKATGIEKELKEFDRREKGEIHPLTETSIDYGFEKNVVNWGLSSHKKGLMLPSKTLRDKAMQIGYKLIQIPEIIFPNSENSVKFRYSYGTYLLIIDCYEDRIEIAQISSTYEDYKKFGIVLEKKSFHRVSYDNIDVINSIIREFYETDDEGKKRRQ